MAHTPKSERQLRKANVAETRAARRSHADLSDNNGRAHRAHAAAFDRYDAKHAHNTRDYGRAVRRGHE